MNKLQLTAALATLLLSASALHAQQSPNNPTQHGLRRVLSYLPPDARAILAKQIAAGSAAAAKPTADERLIAVAGIYGNLPDQEHDSITYQYSGTRGSNLTTNFYSYEDNYFPASSLDNSVYEQVKPTLEYDTSRYYALDGTTMVLNEWTSRIYNAANDVTGMAHKSYESNGDLSAQAYLTVGYNGSNQMTDCMVYDDTSALLTGAFQLTRTVNAVYSGALRTSDTSDNWFGGSHSRSATTYSYDGAGHMTMREQADYEEGSGTWYLGNRNLYAYDAAGRLTNDRREYWDGTTWTVDLEDTFGYTGTSPNFTFNDQYYFNFGGGGVDTYRIVTTLNANGAWDSLYAYSAGSGNGNLGLNGAFSLQYNSNNHLTLVQGTEYDYSTGDASANTSRYYYEAAGSNGVADVHQRVADFASLYPNPAGNATNIRIADPQGRVDIAVTNMAGQVVFQQSCPASTGIVLNTASLPAGSYQVTVAMNGAAQTLTLVKQ